LVLTGISTEQELAKLDYQPTWVMRNIQEVAETLRQAYLNKELERQ